MSDTPMLFDRKLLRQRRARYAHEIFERERLIAFVAIRFFLGNEADVIPPQIMGIMFGGVAGIMVYISLDELLPTSRAYGKGHDSIIGLVLGMAVMAISLLLMR